MKFPREEGTLRVTQPSGNPRDPELTIRDFDATEWSHKWVRLGDMDVLRVTHDNIDSVKDSFEFVEFSTPVQIEFIAD